MKLTEQVLHNCTLTYSYIYISRKENLKILFLIRPNYFRRRDKYEKQLKFLLL